MIDLQKKIEERFETGKEESKHLITIAASTIPAQYILPKILMKFNERYPKEQVKLLETDSSQVVTQIIDHMVDVGFTGTVLEKKHCKYIPFYKDELVVITPNTEKYQKLLEDMSDDISWIGGEHLIMREEGSVGYWCCPALPHKAAWSILGHPCSPPERRRSYPPAYPPA